MTWRERVQQATTWDELGVILSQADAAFRGRKLTLPQVETLTAMAVERARKVEAKVPTTASVWQERIVEWQSYEEAA